MSQLRFTSAERNLKIAEARILRAGGLTYEKIGQRLGVSSSAIFRWIGTKDPYGSFARGTVLAIAPRTPRPRN